MKIPTTHLRRNNTHRLIPSKYNVGEDSVLAQIADDDAHLKGIFALDDATNDRLLAENQRHEGIGLREIVVGFPYASIVNASFAHAHPLGGRFNGPHRGAWYAGFELQTSQAEVVFHKTLQLAEIRRFVDVVTYDDYQADFNATFHDLRNGLRGTKAYLDPNSYVESQLFAEDLLTSGSAGIVYPSVRKPDGTCLCCFRPTLVTNVRKGPTYEFRWDGQPKPKIKKLRG
jgi:hypothetical protein